MKKKIRKKFWSILLCMLVSTTAIPITEAIYNTQTTLQQNISNKLDQKIKVSSPQIGNRMKSFLIGKITNTSVTSYKVSQYGDKRIIIKFTVIRGWLGNSGSATDLLVNQPFTISYYRGPLTDMSILPRGIVLKNYICCQLPKGDLFDPDDSFLPGYNLIILVGEKT
jgi:hypothetical protein